MPIAIAAEAEPVPRIDAFAETPAETGYSRPVAPPRRAQAAEEVSIRDALSEAQRSRGRRRSIGIGRYLAAVWDQIVGPALASKQGKRRLIAVSAALALIAGVWVGRSSLGSGLDSLTRPMQARAFYTIEQDFKGSLDRWTDAKVLNRQEDGLVEVGEGLTLFSPSIARSDYELTFSGAIRRGALNWAVRAADPDNYYAFKLTRRGKGRERRSVLVRYAMVNGVAPPPEKHQVVAIPFELDDNKVYTITVTVNGDRITTAIDDRGVDSFADTRLKGGGVGFFGEKGETGLLHSLSVSGNDDGTGRAIAWFLGFSQFLASKVFGS